MPDGRRRPRQRQAQGKVELDDAVFAEPFHTAARVRGRARRAARAAARHRRDARRAARSGAAARSPGARRAPAAPAPARSARPHWTGGGVAFGPTPRSYTVKVNRKARRRRCARRCRVHAEPRQLAVLDAGRFDEPRPSRPRLRSTDCDEPRPRARAARRGGGALREVVPQHRARRRAAGRRRRRRRPDRRRSLLLSRPRSSSSTALARAHAREAGGGVAWTRRR